MKIGQSRSSITKENLQGTCLLLGNAHSFVETLFYFSRSETPHLALYFHHIRLTEMFLVVEYANYWSGFQLKDKYRNFKCIMPGKVSTHLSIRCNHISCYLKSRYQRTQLDFLGCSRCQPVPERVVPQK